MPEEKQEVLQRIDDIRHHLIERQAFFPYNYKATFVWSLIAFTLTLGMVPMYMHSIPMATAAVFLLIVTGFIAEAVMTKQINKSYDIEECTRRQRFVTQSFVMIALFLIVLSTIFALHKLYIPMLLSWLFGISLGYFVVGFVLNIRAFSILMRINMLTAVVLLFFGLFLGHITGIEPLCYRLAQAALIAGLSIAPAVIAWKHLRKA